MKLILWSFLVTFINVEVRGQHRSRNICQTMQYRQLGLTLQNEHQCMIMQKLTNEFESEKTTRQEQFVALQSILLRVDHKMRKIVKSNGCKGKGYPHLKGIPQARDCNEIRMAGVNVSGVYTIKLPTNSLLNVYCDMDSDGDGWTLIQRRMDGSVNFTRDWNSYSSGFGNVNTEFWLGNQNLHYMTISTNYSLRVDLWDFEGNHSYALYDYFYLENERDGYRLNIGKFLEGDAADSLRHYHNRVKFSTIDKDNDRFAHGSCAQKDAAGWWFKSCAFASLNGIYKNSVSPMIPGGMINGIYWYAWKQSYSNLRRTEMKIKPRATLQSVMNL